MTSTEFANSKYQPLAMPMPFGANSDSNYVAPSTTQVATSPNFLDGFPAAFSSPHSGGGQYVTRQQMNGIGNLASRYEFYKRVGGINTFNPAFASAVGGYPAGAVLDFLDGTNLHKVYSLVDNNQVNFLESGIDGVNWQYLNLDEGSKRSYILSVDSVPSSSDSAIGTFRAARTGALSLESSLVSTDTDTSTVTWAYNSTATATYNYVWSDYGILIVPLGSGSTPSDVPAISTSSESDVLETGTIASNWTLLLGSYNMSVAKCQSNNWTYQIGVKHSMATSFVEEGTWYCVKLFNTGRRLTSWTFSSGSNAVLSMQNFTLSGGFKLFYTA